MRVYALDRPVDVTLLETDEWPHPPHSHHFFELIRIVQGEGRHRVRGQGVEYHPDSLFLVVPGIEHTFEIGTTSTFEILCIERSCLSFLGARFSEENHKLLERLSLPPRPGTAPAEAVPEGREKQMALLSITLLREEFQSRRLHGNLLIPDLLGAVIKILARHAPPADAPLVRRPGESHCIEDILCYIHSNLPDRGKLRSKALAKKFHMGEDYIGQFFKSKVHRPLQKYVQDLRLNAAMYKLSRTDASVKQIADEAGFTDYRHFHKAFRRRFGEPPGLARSRTHGQGPSEEDFDPR